MRMPRARLLEGGHGNATPTKKASVVSGSQGVLPTSDPTSTVTTVSATSDAPPKNEAPRIEMREWQHGVHPCVPGAVSR